jgi:hypothetical protein
MDPWLRAVALVLAAAGKLTAYAGRGLRATPGTRRWNWKCKNMITRSSMLVMASTRRSGGYSLHSRRAARGPTSPVPRKGSLGMCC